MCPLDPRMYQFVHVAVVPVSKQKKKIKKRLKNGGVNFLEILFFLNIAKISRKSRKISSKIGPGFCTEKFQKNYLQKYQKFKGYG